MWDLYLFPGGKVGTRKTRAGVWLWMAMNIWSMSERRAINRETGEHIVT